MFIKDLSVGQKFTVGNSTVYRATYVHNGPEAGTVVRYVVPSAPAVPEMVLTVPKLTTVYPKD